MSNFFTIVINLFCFIKRLFSPYFLFFDNLIYEIDFSVNKYFFTLVKYLTLTVCNFIIMMLTLMSMKGVLCPRIKYYATSKKKRENKK